MTEDNREGLLQPYFVTKGDEAMVFNIGGTDYAFDRETLKTMLDWINININKLKEPNEE